MADTKDNAVNEIFYVTTSLPSSESALRLPSNYTAVGLVKTMSEALTRAMLDANDKSSGDGTTEVYGRLGGTVNVAGNRAKDGNAGMKIVRDAIIAKTKLYYLKSDNTVGNEASHGTVLVTGYTEGSDDDAVRKADASFSVQGVPSFFTIQT